MGLWVLSESIRTWQAAGRDIDLLDLLAAAAEHPGLACTLDMTDERLLPPGDMPGRLLAMAAETHQELSDDPVAICRCILDSLAVAYRRTIARACALAGREVSVVHIVGGGCQNTLLCQLTAEATGLPVIAGPAEGTALGNLLVQARACGALSGDRTALRQVAIASSELTTYTPGVLPFAPGGLGRAERQGLPRQGLTGARVPDAVRRPCDGASPVAPFGRRTRHRTDVRRMIGGPSPRYKEPSPRMAGTVPSVQVRRGRSGPLRPGGRRSPSR